MGLRPHGTSPEGIPHLSLHVGIIINVHVGGHHARRGRRSLTFHHFGVLDLFAPLEGMKRGNKERVRAVVKSKLIKTS